MSALRETVLPTWSRWSRWRRRCARRRPTWASSVRIRATGRGQLLGLDDHLDRVGLGDLDDLGRRPDGQPDLGLGDRRGRLDPEHGPALEVDAEVEAGTTRLISEITRARPRSATALDAEGLAVVQAAARDTRASWSTAARMPTKRPSWNRRSRVSRETEGRAKNQAAKKSIRWPGRG